MKKLFILIALILISGIYNNIQAESLFTLGATSSYAGSPKSLFSGAQARQIGDLLSIVMNESVALNDNLDFTSERTSNTKDSFTSFFNKWFGFNLDGTDGYGGTNKVESSAQGKRNFTYVDKIAVQVVQQLPNGNLSVQGKKIIVNGNERIDMIVTGVVDPRWIDENGQVQSYNVANLQFALSGRGAISRGQNEGIFNRIIRYLF